ncbi:hypothetical protein [Pseudomonas sp. KNUC1026]|uniref:hypothetical protein n=1 Tax=Pseudomonas sp. KNUC1026 TaxID=2893890 RepID=UPI001F380414|nr:hypothetical protein [Pseudomonas sp. KNUC1026]UFH49959.1 hypothetical protein LN139_00810 [Pseudomonas sp. KNUC1026]
MKRTALAGLFLSTALLGAAPAFAAEDLCQANLQKIDNELATVAPSNPSLAKTLKASVDKAKADQAAGNTKDCIAESQKVLTQLDKTTKKGSGAGN